MIVPSQGPSGPSTLKGNMEEKEVIEMAERGKAVGEILGLRLVSFSPNYTYTSKNSQPALVDCFIQGEIKIPEIAVNQIYLQSLEIELLKTKAP